MELTYDEYALLGGTCPKELFQRCKLEAEAELAEFEATYVVDYNTPESKTLALIALIDNSFTSYQALQTGGQVMSVRIGSYSETKKSESISTAYTSAGRSKDLLSRYARLFRKAVGVIR